MSKTSALSVSKATETISRVTNCVQSLGKAIKALESGFNMAAKFQAHTSGASGSNATSGSVPTNLLSGLAAKADATGIFLTTIQMKAEDMASVCNSLAAPCASSSTKLTSLAKTMEQVSQVAGGVGTSLQETAAIVGRLNLESFKGEQAGEAFCSGIMSLIEPSQKATEVLNQIGFSGSRDAAGNMRPLMDMLDEIATKTMNLGLADCLTVFSTLVGDQTSPEMVPQGGDAIASNSRKPFQAPQTASSEGFVSNESQVSRSLGTLKTMGDALKSLASTMTSSVYPVLDSTCQGLQAMGISTTAATDKFKVATQTIASVGTMLDETYQSSMGLVGAWESMKADVQTVKGAYKDLKNGIAGARDWMTRFNLTSKSSAATSKVLAAGQWLLNTSVNGVRTAFLAVRSVMAAAQTRLVAFNLASKAGAVAQGLMTAAQWALNVAMTANPIGLIIAGVAALGAAAYAVWNHWDTIKSAIFGFWDGVVSWLDSFSLADSGVKIVKSLAGGIMSAAMLPFKAIGWVTSKVMSFFSSSSDENAPTDNLPDSGAAMVKTVGKGSGAAGAVSLSKPLAGSVQDMPPNTITGVAGTPSSGQEINITVSPNITIGSGADGAQVHQAVGQAMTVTVEQLRELLARYAHEERRLSFA